MIHLTRCLTASLFIWVPTLAFALPTDTPDEDLSKAADQAIAAKSFRPRKRPGARDHSLEIARTKHGDLITAFVEAASSGTRLVVMKKDPQGLWTVLEDRSYMFDTIEDISLDVADDFPSSAGNDRVYVALHLRHGHQHFIGLASGSMHAPWWSRSARFDLAFVQYLDEQAGVLLPDGPAGEPDVAVIPERRSGDYSVGVAFEWNQRFEEPGRKEGAEPFVYDSDGIYLTFSTDHGRSLGDALHMVGRGSIGTRGPDDLLGDRYVHPSLAADTANDAVLLAFEDLDKRQVRLVFGAEPNTVVTQSSQRNPLELVDLAPNTFALDGQWPRVTASTGEVHLSYLGLRPSGKGGFSLNWLQGRLYNVSFLLTSMGLHADCRPPGDIEAREGRVYLAAACYPDQQSLERAFAFEIHTGAASSFEAIVDDAMFLRTTSPRVAVTPASAPHLRVVTTGYLAAGLRLNHY